MYNCLTNLLLDCLRRGFDCIDESFKKDISKNLDDFWKSQYANDLYYVSFVLLLIKALRGSINYEAKVEFEGLDLIHKCALARILFLLDKRDENLIKAISKEPINSVYDIFLKAGVMSDFEVDMKIDSFLNKLKFFSKFGGGFSNIINSQYSSNNASAAALCGSYILGKSMPKKSVDFLMNNQDASGGFFAEKDSPIPDLLTTATSLFALSLYGFSPKYDALDFIEAHCLDDAMFSATIKDDRGDLEYTFYGILAIGAMKSI
ncbi:MAG: hypothetical protein R3Y46_07010 [Opitutales bacterium]